MTEIEELIKKLETLTGKKVTLSEEVIEEGFAVQTPNPKQGQDPMF
jgi:hypothetical protein